MEPEEWQRRHNGWSEEPWSVETSGGDDEGYGDGETHQQRDS
jgi:hypothetical protein